MSGRRKQLRPLADPARKPWVKKALDRRDFKAEREALKDPEVRQRTLEHLRDAIKRLEE